MWIKRNEYYLECEGWTICKCGITTVKYGLWQGAFNRGWFNSSKEAIIEHERLIKIIADS